MVVVVVVVVVVAAVATTAIAAPETTLAPTVPSTSLYENSLLNLDSNETKVLINFFPASSRRAWGVIEPSVWILIRKYG